MPPLPRLLTHALALLLAAAGVLSPRSVHAASPVLSEFMADNRSTLADEDGEFVDWIELSNPGAAPIDLTGYALTDDPKRPNRWLFPAVTLAPGEHRVVFASGKNRRIPTSPLHTDFRLDADGDYLALVAPDGHTIVDAFAPAFPRQYSDVSYGRPPTITTRDLLATSPLAVKVPIHAHPLEAAWIEPGFQPDPMAGWLTGPGFGVGYEAGFAGGGADGNLARNGTATQSTTASGYSPSLAIDGNLATFTHTVSNDNQSSWTLDLGRETEVTHVVLHNRGDCCQSRLRDITVTFLAPDATTVRWRSPLLNPENALDGPARLDVDLFDLGVGPVSARFVRVERTPDPDLSGSNGLGNADEDSVLTLAEVEVQGTESVTFAPLIRTDVAAAMRGQSAALAVRCDFGLGLDAMPAPTSSLQLRLRFDDGFVAWLNGQPIARTNVPEDASGDSHATAARPDAEALTPVTYEIPSSLLVPGTNTLALLGLNVSPDDDDFLIDARLESTGTYTPPPAYFERPTPGAPNDANWYLGRLSAPHFNVERSFPSAPFDLALTLPTDDAAATIRVTLDGSEPTESHGEIYRQPLRIDHTTVVRARAIRAEYRASAVATHTYLFPEATARQPANPDGFPARWADVAADYPMDPDITQNPLYASRIADSLRALPSVCFSMNVDDLFGASRGIYANPENRGTNWERAVSMEWIDPTANREFQANAGLRIQGGYFRQRGVTQKHSLRVVFKAEYGTGRLRENLFDTFGAAREFDTLVLRAGANDGYAWDAAIDTEQFLRDEFGRRLALAMGQTASHGRFVHVYLNGLYWGLYDLCERPNEDFSATYLGGDASEWDAINSGEIKSGDLAAWNRFTAALPNTRTTDDFLRLQGLDPDGSRNAALPVYLNLDNYLDYMLLNIWGGNWDWPNKNFWFGRRRTADSTGFYFYPWDFENTMGNNRDRSPLGMVSPRAGITSEWVAAPHARLKSLPEYQLRFADRVQRHLLNDGPLTPAALVARYRSMADALELAVIAETARWGDDNHEPPQDLADWQRERDWLLGTYLPRRTEVVLGQFRAAGLYPNVTAPVVVTADPSAGVPTSPVLRTPARWLYYTLDGTDPRLPGGSPNPAAVRAEFATEVVSSTANPTLVAPDASWKYWDLGTDPGPTWTLATHDDANWLAGPAQLGYGDGDEATVVRAVDTDPTQSGTQRNATTYFRRAFTIPNPAAYETFNLEVTYDDAAAVYLNGREILRTDNLPATATFTTFATADRGDNSVETRTGLPTNLLVAGTNIIAAEIHQRSASSSDLSFALSLVGVPRPSADPTADWNATAPLQLTHPTRILARSWNGSAWSALTDVRVTPDAIAADASSLVISEIAYRPPDAGNPLELAASKDRDDYEFVELLNTGSRPIDLARVRLAGGVEFAFAFATDSSAILAPGSRALVVANRSAFAVRYGTNLPVVGEFRGHLGNEGDVLRLETADGTVLHHVAWNLQPPWPSAAATNGASLVLVDPTSHPVLSEPANWRSSTQAGGNPGTTDAQPFTGRPDADADGNGRLDLVDYALGAGDGALEVAWEAPEGNPSSGALAFLRLAHPRNPAADEVRLAIETAETALGPWESAASQLTYLGAQTQSDGRERVEYRCPAPTAGAASRFFRLVVLR